MWLRAVRARWSLELCNLAIVIVQSSLPDWKCIAPPLCGDNPPDHGQCQAVSMRPCWHDGTSSYAMDKLLPMWKASNANLVDTFQMVVTEYEKRFGNGEKS